MKITEMQTTKTRWSEPRLFANGEVEGKSESAVIRFEVEGVIASVTTGSELAAGEIIASVESSQAIREHQLEQTRLRQAESDYVTAKELQRHEMKLAATLARQAAEAAEHAESDYERLKSGGTSVSCQALERAKSDAAIKRLQADEAIAKEGVTVATLENRVWSAHNAIAIQRLKTELAEIKLKKHYLYAPFNCQVLDISGQPGELASQFVAVVADSSTIQVRAYVEESQAPFVEIGQECEVITEAGGGILGRISYVASSMDRKKVFRGHPSERVDVKTREIIVSNLRRELGEVNLIIGQPVDVKIFK